jgi:hypothetical protein
MLPKNNNHNNLLVICASSLTCHEQAIVQAQLQITEVIDITAGMHCTFFSETFADGYYSWKNGEWQNDGYYTIDGYVCDGYKQSYSAHHRCELNYPFQAKRLLILANPGQVPTNIKPDVIMSVYGEYATILYSNFGEQLTIHCSMLSSVVPPMRNSNNFFNGRTSPHPHWLPQPSPYYSQFGASPTNNDDFSPWHLDPPNIEPRDD